MAAADAGSFRRAALRLGYAQSAVSQQIAGLERAVRSRLIERGQGNRGLVLTDTGHALLGHAEHVVDQLGAARADLACLARGGPLRVAVEPAAGALLSRLMRSAGAATELAVSVTEMPATAQVGLVRDDVLDLAVGCFPDLDSRLASRVLYADRWVLVAPDRDAPAFLSSPIPPASLRGLPLIEERSHPIPLDVQQLGTRTVTSCDRVGTALELVRAGTGSAILPRLSVDGSDARVRVIELGGLLPRRIVSVIWCGRRRLPGSLAAHMLAAAAGDAERGPDTLSAVA